MGLLTPVFAWSSVLTMCLVRSAFGAPPQPPSAIQAQEPALEFRIDPLIDLIFLTRSIDPTDDEERNAARPELLAAAEAGAALDRALGNPLSWGLLADIFTSAESVAEMVTSCEALPEEIHVSTGTLRIRTEAISFARALAAAESCFLSDLWPARKAEIEGSLESIQAHFEGATEPWMPFVLKHLNMTDPQAAILVYLVGNGPWPGAVTYRSRGSGGICFVAIDSAKGTQLIETIIHETIHALDVSTADEPTALQQLREGLRDAGVAPADPLFRDLPHLIIFMQAAETTRRCIDADHVDYGETEGVYDRLVPDAASVREHWRRYLDRGIDLEQTLQSVVAAALAKERAAAVKEL